jgi:hypothetical protein
MKVKAVHAGITRGQYSRALHSRAALEDLDRRELGNVVWIEMHLSGYDGKTLILEYGAYNAHALIPGTWRQTSFAVQGDQATRFEAIWIGYPKTPKFQEQFRLVDRDNSQVRQMARTGAMNGRSFRYLCT